MKVLFLHFIRFNADCVDSPRIFASILTAQLTHQYRRRKFNLGFCHCCSTMLSILAFGAASNLMRSSSDGFLSLDI